jgi:HD-GYP domain-containing protein (c-di-GMP phosphodiesterase class II)
MSWDPPSGGPSPAADDPGREPELGLASVVRLRGIALIEALERHVPGAREHAEAAGSYAFAAAARLGLERGRAEAIREAAKLHDIGLVYIGANTLLKGAEQLDEDERGALALHPETGAQLAHGAGIPDEVCEWLRRWGENFDGSGAGGFAGEDIPLESRIIHAACRCDAALAAPAPGPGREEAAASHLRGLAGSVLDPGVAETIAAVLDRSAANR